jgi:hypothetical protein
LNLVLDNRIPLLPFVEQRPLHKINDVFAAVHHGAIKRRVILVPESE